MYKVCILVSNSLITHLHPCSDLITYPHPSSVALKYIFPSCPKVLASAEVVSRCAPGPLHATALASSMGAFKLKGVPEPVEVFAVK